MADSYTFEVHADDEASDVLERVEDKVDGFDSQMQSSQETASVFSDVLGAELVTQGLEVATQAFTQGASAVASWTQEVAKNAEQVQELSEVTGANVETVQRLENVYKRAGLEGDALRDNLFRLSERLSEARKRAGGMRDDMLDAGFTMQQLKEDIEGPDQALIGLLRRIKNAESRTEALAASEKVLGGESQQLVTELRSTDESLEELIGSADEYGTVLEEKAIDRQARFNDQLKRARGEWEEFQLLLVQTVIPTLTRTLELMNAPEDQAAITEAARDRGVGAAQAQLAEQLRVGITGAPHLARERDRLPDEIVSALEGGALGGLDRDQFESAFRQLTRQQAQQTVQVMRQVAEESRGFSFVGGAGQAARRFQEVAQQERAREFIEERESETRANRQMFGPTFQATSPFAPGGQQGGDDGAGGGGGGAPTGGGGAAGGGGGGTATPTTGGLTDQQLQVQQQIFRLREEARKAEERERIAIKAQIVQRKRELKLMKLQNNEQIKENERIKRRGEIMQNTADKLADLQRQQNQVRSPQQGGKAPGFTELTADLTGGPATPGGPPAPPPRQQGGGLQQSIRGLQSTISGLSNTVSAAQRGPRGGGSPLGGVMQLAQSGIGLGQTLAGMGAGAGVLGPIGAVLGAAPGIIGGIQQIVGGGRDKDPRRKVATVGLDRETINRLEEMRARSAEAFAQELEDEQRTRDITVEVGLSPQADPAAGQLVSQLVEDHSSAVSGDDLTLGS